MDYSLYPKTFADPEVVNMIESYRAVGYNLETAVADILDNSISAGAKNIWINFEWSGSETSLSIKDDGIGMSNDELINSMRFGSSDPNKIRDCKDLGRFGLGLKTASFSQCRKFTVISKKAEGKLAYWTWDIDFIYHHSKKWELVAYLPEGNWEEQIEALPSGTIVIWNDIDRIVKNLKKEDKRSSNKFLQIMEMLKKHLGMVFHRFIESKKIKIFLQQREIEPWNPFLISHSATQNFPEDPLQNSQVKLRGFVLPHKSKLTEMEFGIADGIRGWNAQQGFYIYRAERMLLAGNWLGLFRKEEQYKLARIMLDLPNNLDSEWQIDIKKSIARPPLILKEQLKAYATSIRLHAIDVYRHKGKILSRKFNQSPEFQSVWIEKLKHGKRFYEINREHPLIKDFNGSTLNSVLRLLEETIPIHMITIQEFENSDFFFKPFESESNNELISLMKVVYQSLLNNNTSEEAKNRLHFMEPFNEYPEIIASL